ncbi:MAG: hypothetical protein AAGF53_09985, partial [Pseudomonadota bacterium]
MSDWIALGTVADGFCAFALSGEVLFTRSRGTTEAQALANVPFEGPVFRIGDGPAERLPVSVLPEPGAAYLSGLEQKQPADLISAWVRLWIS